MKNFQEINLPVPGEYDDWRSWASSLIRVLEEHSSQTYNLPLWVRNSSKPRDGLPIGADGDLIRVLDLDNTIRFYCWSEADEEWQVVGS